MSATNSLALLFHLEASFKNLTAGEEYLRMDMYNSFFTAIRASVLVADAKY